MTKKPLKPMVDFMRRPIRVGQTIVYTARQSGTPYLVLADVYAVESERIYVKIRHVSKRHKHFVYLRDPTRLVIVRDNVSNSTEEVTTTTTTTEENTEYWRHYD